MKINKPLILVSIVFLIFLILASYQSYMGGFNNGWEKGYEDH